MAGELARELSQFPFAKLKPRGFQLKIAALARDALANLPIRIWVETSNIPEVIQLAGSAHVLRTYPHLDLVYLETFGDALSALVKNDLVRSVWNDEPTKADGCLVVFRPDSDPRPLAAGSDRRAC